MEFGYLQCICKALAHVVRLHQWARRVMYGHQCGTWSYRLRQHQSFFTAPNLILETS